MTASPAAGGHKTIRVLLVDDHQLVTDALSRLLVREPDMAVVGIAATVAEARDLARRPVDVVLMDYRLPDGTGAEATKAIKARWPACRVVMLSGVYDDETILGIGRRPLPLSRQTVDQPRMPRYGHGERYGSR